MSANLETTFEAEWGRIKRGEFEVIGKPKIRPVFFSLKHQIMAVVDPFSKFTDQFVIAPAKGTPGKRAHFHDLRAAERQKLHYVADAIGKVILSRNGNLDLEIEERPTHRAPVEHIEGHANPDHAHIIVFGAYRTESARLYGPRPAAEDLPSMPDLGSDALDKTAHDYALALSFPQIERGLQALESIRSDL